MSQESLREFALINYGVFTTKEAFEHISKHQLHYLLSKNLIRQAAPQVWTLNLADKNWEQSVIAAMKSLSPKATLCRIAAAKWWDLGSWAEPAIAVAVPRRERGARRDFTIVGDEIPFAQRQIKRGVQVTTVERTIIDLAVDLDQIALGNVIDEVIFRRVASIPKLEALLKKMPSHKQGLQKIHRELARRNETDKRLMSRFEKEVVVDLRRSGLPEPVGQQKIIFDDETYFPDFCWPELKIIVEVDGGHHDDPRQMRVDRLRRNRLGSMGYSIQHFGDETHTPTFMQQLKDLMKIRAA